MEITEYSRALGIRLQKSRCDKGLTQQQVAEILYKGKSTPAIRSFRTTIAQFEAGSRNPDCEMLSRLARLYDVPADYLLGLTPVPTHDPVIKSMCEYLGLSEESISYLHKSMWNQSIGEFTNTLLESGLYEVIVGFADTASAYYSDYLRFNSEQFIEDPENVLAEALEGCPAEFESKLSKCGLTIAPLKFAYERPVEMSSDIFSDLVREYIKGKQTHCK